jgi:hypothetical protein
LLQAEPLGPLYVELATARDGERDGGDQQDEGDGKGEEEAGP